MSVVTTFDEKKEEAVEALGVAIAALTVCVNGSTWGYSDIKDSFIDELHEVLAELVKLKRKLR